MTRNGTTRDSLPAEIVVLSTCAQAHPPESSLSNARRLIGSGLDWDTLLALAVRQAVVPIVNRTLRSWFTGMVPQAMLEALGAQALLYAQHNLTQLQNLVEATTLLRDAGIASLTFKGLIQSQLVYGDIVTRWGGDIDLLVQESQFEAARDLFVTRGFQRLLRAPMERKLRESGLWHEQRRIKVDLHFGIGPDHLDIAAAPLWGNARSVSIGAYGFEGFGASDVVLVSCVNAVKEYWSQSLYRYCDIHEMVSNYGEQNWDTLLSRSNALGCRRMTELALLVTYRVLGTPSLEGIAQTARPARSIARAADELIAQMFYGEDTEQALESKAPLFFFNDKQQYSIALRDKRSRRIAERLELIFGPNRFDREFIHLPSMLSPMYYLIRPVRLATEFARSLPQRLRR